MLIVGRISIVIDITQNKQKSLILTLVLSKKAWKNMGRKKFNKVRFKGKCIKKSSTDDDFNRS